MARCMGGIDARLILRAKTTLLGWPEIVVIVWQQARRLGNSTPTYYLTI